MLSPQNKVYVGKTKASNPIGTIPISIVKGPLSVKERIEKAYKYSNVRLSCFPAGPVAFIGYNTGKRNEDSTRFAISAIASVSSFLN